MSLVDGYDKGIDWLREGDVHPGDKATVIVKGSNGLFAGDMRFGMTAAFGKAAPEKEPAKDAAADVAERTERSKSAKLLINAKAETVREKKSFAESIAECRCVIPAKKFYEWDKDRNKAEFSSLTEKSVYLAGIYRYEDNERAEQAAPKEKAAGNGHFVILTTAANDSMKPVHDRMPLILTRDQIVPWLSDAEKADEILSQTPADLSVYREFEQLSLF